MLTLRVGDHLALRATQGWARALLALLEVALPGPHYSTLSRRAAEVQVALGALPRSGPLHLVSAASGFTVYGAGQWQGRRHGWSTRRTWRTRQLAVEEATGEIVAAGASAAGVSEDDALPDLLARVPGERGQVSAEGAYAKRRGSEAIAGRGATAVLAARREVTMWHHANCAAPRRQRDENVRAIRSKGRRRWPQEVGYPGRSLAATAFFRCKTLCGPTLHAREFPHRPRNSCSKRRR